MLSVFHFVMEQYTLFRGNVNLVLKRLHSLSHQQYKSISSLLPTKLYPSQYARLLALKLPSTSGLLFPFDHEGNADYTRLNEKYVHMGVYSEQDWICWIISGKL